ncbi:glycosyltransferase [Actinomycetospora lutea]|uniref:glycosyltransferase n=1 Tax=Actinomycetospora lutea TaxID=663604 RepID=UPI0023662A9A|nr:glycosyltransferase [Actinomycetospora lutea]MDD7940811.1 glycosyltransferase [Actinomycetospora lutea]
MTFLVLTSRRLESRQSGYDIRVAHLCAHLPGEAHLVIAPMEPLGPAGPGLPGTEDLFASTEELPALTGPAKSLRRHLRRSDDHVLEAFHPAEFARAAARLQEIVDERGITDVVVFGGDVAELAATLHGPRVTLDVCDSTALTTHRSLAWSSTPAQGLRRWKDRLKVHRKRATESRFAQRFDRVVTISGADSRAVEGGRAPGTVGVVPNGVDEAFAGPLGEPGERRGVAFWGNLTFGPNRDALWFFVHQVWLPTLRHEGVELCIVGAGAPDWLVEIAGREPLMTLTGWVDDLRPVVRRYPIMINPMRSGSGLKNKVLEAFGLGLVVVTTALGVEALPDVVDGTHVVVADEADDLAAAVLAVLDAPARREALRTAAHSLVDEHYRWEVIGRAWRRLFEAQPSGARRPGV